MSQHRVTITDLDGQDRELLLGWDPPLQRYFLDVENPKLEEDDPQRMLFCSMYTRKYIEQNMTVQDLKSECDNLRIQLPLPLWKELESENGASRDGLNGQKVVEWEHSVRRVIREG